MIKGGGKATNLKEEDHQEVNDQDQEKGGRIQGGGSLGSG